MPPLAPTFFLPPDVGSAPHLTSYPESIIIFLLRIVADNLHKETADNLAAIIHRCRGAENTMHKHVMNRLVASTLLLFVSIAWGAPVLVPTLDANLDSTNSTVYCPTFQIAWDGLRSLVGGPIAMQRQDVLVDQLNSKKCPSNIVPEQAYVAMAGVANQDFTNRLEQALRAKFGDKAPALPQLPWAEDVFVSYAHLQRQLPFPRKFLLSKRPWRFSSNGTSNSVQCFGASADVADDYDISSVRILHYAGPNDFAIRLASKIRGEFIVLSKMDKPANLRVGAAQMLKLIQAPDKGITEATVNGTHVEFSNTLSQGDILAIPVVDLTVAAEFPQLCDRLFTIKGFEDHLLFDAYQNVIFRMDEAGAVVKSTASISDMFGAVPEPPPPRWFVFNKPFLLTIWKGGAEKPYLAIWVASPDVLVPFKKK